MESGSQRSQAGAQSREEIPDQLRQCLPGQSPSGFKTSLKPSVVIQVDPDDPLGLNRIRNSLLDQSRNGNGSRSGNGGGDSPESTSLYSDEIPSGYNSGEQYDTLSTGYMSGEAYELPETRMELREPTLDPIEEGRGSLGGNPANSDDNIFVHIATEVGAVGAVGPGLTSEDKKSVNSLTTTSSSDQEGNGVAAMDQGWGGVPIEANVLHSPIAYSAVKPKLRKKEAYESSDAGVGVASSAGGYRVVPSDTDTSAVDSDANAVLTDGGENESSGTELLRAAHRQSKSGAKRMRRNLLNHDENWFNSRDNKYWSLSRTVCFWLTMLSMVTSIVTAGIMIAWMPTNCDPQRKWFQGSVIMDLRVAGVADLRHAESRLDFYSSLGIRAFHLRDVTKKANATSDGGDVVDVYHPTEMTVSLAHKLLGDVDGGDGSPYNPKSGSPLKNFTSALHERNMTLVVQVPVVGSDSESRDGKLSIELQHKVEDAVKFWSEQGVDGVFLEGLEHFGSDSWVGRIVERWHDILHRYGNNVTEKVLMTSYAFAHRLAESGNTEGRDALKFIDLLDATLDYSAVSFNSSATADAIESMAKWDSSEERPWINWNFRFVKNLPLTNAAAAFQMLLPGTINIGSLDDSKFDGDQLRNLTSLRTVAVPINMNGNYKRCDCDEGVSKETNYVVHHPIKDVVQLERFYSRRNRYVLVANFGSSPESLQAIGRIYSGGVLVLDTSSAVAELSTEVLFRQMILPPGQAVVVKIPK